MVIAIGMATMLPNLITKRKKSDSVRLYNSLLKTDVTEFNPSTNVCSSM